MDYTGHRAQRKYLNLFQVTLSEARIPSDSYVYHFVKTPYVGSFVPLTCNRLDLLHFVASRCNFTNSVLD